MSMELDRLADALMVVYEWRVECIRRDRAGKTTEGMEPVMPLLLRIVHEIGSVDRDSWFAALERFKAEDWKEKLAARIGPLSIDHAPIGTAFIAAMDYVFGVKHERA